MAKPHLFLICVDALRADCFRADAPLWREFGAPVTPSLDALRARSRAWSRAYASSSWTKPSVPSMLTSLHPSEHGVLEVERRPDRGVDAAALPDGVATLAELLRDGGYRTHAILHNAQLHGALGFERGYDSYTCEGGTAAEIVDRVAAMRPWTEGPSFVHLHLLDPHWPFPESVASAADGAMTGRYAFHRMRAAEWKELKDDLKSGHVELSNDEMRFLATVYRLAVEGVDRAVGRLMDVLAADGVLEQSAIVFTADHGEELLDHGVVGHGQSLFDELVRVPLWIRVGSEAGGPATAGETSQEPASHVDLLPTLAALARIPVTHRVAGRGLFTESAPAFVFSEVKHKRRYRQAVTDGRWKLVRTWIFDKAMDEKGETRMDTNNLEELFAARERRVEHELYDLDRDPGERTDRSGDDEVNRQRLEAALDRWWEGRQPMGNNTRALEDELIRRLEALGYL